MKEQMHIDEKYLTTSMKDQLFLYLYECDVNDTLLIVEITLRWEKTNPPVFSMGFFIIDLLNFENRSFLISKSPRILMEPEGEIYLNKINKIESVPELLFSIDSDPLLLPVTKIVGPNTIFWLRELMAFVDIKFTPEEIKDLDEDKKFNLKWSRILSGLKTEDFFPPQTVIFSNIELLAFQNLELKIEELELLDYLFKTGRINSSGASIEDPSKKNDLNKSEFGVDIIDTRLVIRINNTWRDIEKYSISLDKEYVRTKNKVITKYSSKGTVVIDKFEPHMLEAFVFSLEFVIKVPTYTNDERMNEFVQKSVEVASFVYLPVIQSSVVEEEEDSELEAIERTVYAFKMVNIDSSMEINPKFMGVRDQNRDPLRIDLITTFSQKEDGGRESSVEEEDVYAIELRKLQEAPLKRITNKNERLNKKFKETKSLLVKQEREVENINKSIDSLQNELKNTRYSIKTIESNIFIFYKNLFYKTLC